MSARPVQPVVADRRMVEHALILHVLDLDDAVRRAEQTALLLDLLEACDREDP